MMTLGGYAILRYLSGGHTLPLPKWVIPVSVAITLVSWYTGRAALP